MVETIPENETERNRLIRELTDTRNHQPGLVSMPMLEAAQYLSEYAPQNEETAELIKQLQDPANHLDGRYSNYMLMAAQVMRDLETTHQ